MYKNTRHTSATWSYKSPGKSRFSGMLLLTNEEARMLLALSGDTLIGLGLASIADYPAPIVSSKDPAALPLLLRKRRAQGSAYLKKMNVPEVLIAQLPNYFLIAPCFTIAQKNLRKLPLERIPMELQSLHVFLKSHPPHSSRRNPRVHQITSSISKSTEAKKSSQQRTSIALAFDAALKKNKS